MKRGDMMKTLLKVIVILVVSHSRIVHGFCPKGCKCDDKRLFVTCSNSTLDVLPIALNTRIQHIKMSFNKIKIVDASFQFYEHLISIDLSSNIVENIEDKSFAAQKSLLTLDLGFNKISDISPKVTLKMISGLRPENKTLINSKLSPTLSF